MGESVVFMIFRSGEKKIFVSLLILGLMLLTGCTKLEDKAASLSVIYGAAAVLALLLLILCCCTARKRSLWFLLLFASVLVVDVGYFALSISRTLDEALLANRLAYLGSVFLPLSMWMIILNITWIRYRKWIPGVMIVLGLVMFLIAASPGYLDIYYKEVTFELVDGVAVLHKVYGPFHSLYRYYLLLYFLLIMATVAYAIRLRKIESAAYGGLLAVAVFVNIGVWLIEQLVEIDFEFLSISYIISECFLLGLHLLMEETKRQRGAAVPAPAETVISEESQIPEELQISEEKPASELFAEGILLLTPTERKIFDLYLEGKGSKEVLQELEIKENTLKFHNRNIYGKLGVSSRKELLEQARKM